jgi:prostaglandin-endoperoxide synthase 2
MLFGDLMTTMVGHDAFTQVLTNPLLAADVYTEATFTRAGLTIIEQTENLRQIAARNAELSTDAAVSFKYVPRRPGAGVAAAGERRSVADHLPADSIGSGSLTDAR